MAKVGRKIKEEKQLLKERDELRTQIAEQIKHMRSTGVPESLIKRKQEEMEATINPRIKVKEDTIAVKRNVKRVSFSLPELVLAVQTGYSMGYLRDFGLGYAFLHEDNGKVLTDDFVKRHELEPLMNKLSASVSGIAVLSPEDVLRLISEKANNGDMAALKILNDNNNKSGEQVKVKEIWDLAEKEREKIFIRQVEYILEHPDEMRDRIEKIKDKEV